jgi:hypothetical protein
VDANTVKTSLKTSINNQFLEQLVHRWTAWCFCKHGPVDLCNNNGSTPSDGDTITTFKMQAAKTNLSNY